MKPESLDFLRLTGRTKPYEKLGVGNKAALLNHAIKSHLPVPNGIVLLDGAWPRLIKDGLLSVDGDDVAVHDADLLLARVAMNSLKQPVAIRSAFSAEDRSDEALAGYFDTQLNVPHDNPNALIHALITVWQSGKRRDGDFRRDILVMDMIDAQVAGVAFTQADYSEDVINYTDGTADKLVSGTVEGQSLTLPKLDGEATAANVAWQRRLQRLLDGVRRTFNLKGADWDIEWADDGTTCWLLQIRPITAPPRRNEAFTYANLKEILPPLPSNFMTSVVTHSAEQCFAWYRQFDRTLPATRPFIETFYGRPLFNLSLLTDMMRHWGLPSRLVTNSIGGSAHTEHGFRLMRFLRKTVPLLRLGWWQLNAVRFAKQRTHTIHQMSQQAGGSFNELGQTFLNLFVVFVTEMLNLTQAMSGPLLILRNSGTLSQHQTSEQTVSTNMFQQFAKLGGLVAAHPEWHPDLESGRLPNDPTFTTAWNAFLTDHGHRGIFESDIARPRYREQQSDLLASLVGAAQHASASEPNKRTGGLKQWLTAPAWWQMSRVMRAREQWRYESMKCYEVMRNQFLTLADAAIERGQLPNREALWLLSLDEMQKLDDGWVVSAETIAQRQQERDRLAQIDVPDLLYRFDDLEEGNSAESPTGDSSNLRGVSLTSGTITGKAWVLHEPALRLPAGFEPSTTILVARSIDAGWIPTFNRVAGVIVEIGGDLSHGSIILREVGLPAITNVKHATRHIQTGDTLQLQADRGRASKETLPAR